MALQRWHMAAIIALVLVQCVVLAAPALAEATKAPWREEEQQCAAAAGAALGAACPAQPLQHVRTHAALSNFEPLARQ